MGDVVFIAVMIGFFLLCTLYVQLCDHMIGADEVASTGQSADSVTGSDSVTQSLVDAQAAAGVAP